MDLKRLGIPILVAISCYSLGLVTQFLLPTYVSEKAKNLATKEDIASITKEVQAVENIYKQHYDLSKAEIEFYENMVRVNQKFLVEIKRYELKTGQKVNNETIIKDANLHKSFLAFIDSANEILANAFVFMDEEHYSLLKKALREERNFAAIRTNLLDAMRSSIHPATTLRAKDDLWDLKYVSQKNTTKTGNLH